MNPRDEPERWTAEVALLVVCLIWGCNFAVMKSALGEVRPFAFNAIRLTLSALFLGIVHYRSGGHRFRLPRGSWIRILGAGLLGYFGYQMFFIAGLARTRSGNASLILSSSPMFTALLGFFLGERLRRQAWIGLAIALAGTVIIALTGDVVFDGDTAWGNLLMLGAACAWGSYTAMARGLAGRVPAATLAFYTTAMTLPLHWCVAIPQLGPVWGDSISRGTWIAIAYSGVLSTGYAYVLWNIGLRKVGASHTTGIVNLVPVIAVLVGWLALDEMVTALQIAGGTLVLGGVWTMHRARTSCTRRLASSIIPDAMSIPV